MLRVHDFKVGGRHDVTGANFTFTTDFNAKATGAIGK